MYPLRYKSAEEEEDDGLEGAGDDNDLTGGAAMHPQYQHFGPADESRLLRKFHHPQPPTGGQGAAAADGYLNQQLLQRRRQEQAFRRYQL